MCFSCAGNSARSILAEAILRKEGAGCFSAFFRRIPAEGQGALFAIEVLKSLKHDTSFARSKSWDEFAAPGAPKMDFVFTVCGSGQRGMPCLARQPVTAHWGIPDPAAAQGTDAEKRLAFAEAYRQLASRISAFLSLPLASIDRMSLKSKLREIGSPTCSTGSLASATA